MDGWCYAVKHPRYPTRWSKDVENEKVIPPAPPKKPDEARELNPVRMMRRGEDTFDSTEEHVTFSDFRPSVLPADAPEVEPEPRPKDSSAQVSASISESPKRSEQTQPESSAQTPVEKESGAQSQSESGKQDSSSDPKDG